RGEAAIKIATDISPRRSRSKELKCNNFRILRTTLLQNLRETRKFFASRNPRRFGYSPRQDAKNAKFGNLFLLCAFASSREMFRFFLVAASPRCVPAVK